MKLSHYPNTASFSLTRKPPGRHHAGFIFCLVMSVLLSCDSFHEDEPENLDLDIENTFYTNSNVLPTPFGLGFSSMDFIDSQVGYVAGPGIFKTIDGGSHWKKVSPKFGSDSLSFVDIQFLNDQDGFAIYSSRSDMDTPHFLSGLATTKDGGDTWTLMPMENEYLSSVHFTTPLSGVIGAGYVKTETLKTEDGGLTWKKVLDHVAVWSGWFDVRIEFATDNVGYACLTEIIFKTEDGGSSWKPEIKYEGGMTSAAYVLSADTLLIARSGVGEFDLATDIVTYVNGKFVSSFPFPFKIRQIAFSPTKQTGFAVGMKGNNLVLYRSSDRGRSWALVKSYVVTNAYALPNDIQVLKDDVVLVLHNNCVYSYER